MSSDVNEHGQAVGSSLPGWVSPPVPPHTPMEGRLCRLVPLDAALHGPALYAANQPDDGSMWTYLPYGPFPDLGSYLGWLTPWGRQTDPLSWAILDAASGEPVGLAGYLRIDPANGVIEVGHLHFSPRLRRRAAATEAMFLMMGRAFELGYRRYEWKCDSLNAPSRRAAERLGFQFEGLFRQAIVYKGRTRDTAWYSVIDSEWAALRSRFTQWLDPGNFDLSGGQRRRLEEC
ncbi:MAG TPA: GNAT family N-acetyltransferase [Verrucomicrobiales bacterium]|nr:GNAT family N-acetyltransferase [Verrucomicrobiales bacterium]